MKPAKEKPAQHSDEAYIPISFDFTIRYNNGAKMSLKTTAPSPEAARESFDIARAVFDQTNR